MCDQMKRLLFFLTMMAAVALTSCRREPVNDAENGVGTFVDATFTVALGPETRAYADGTSVNRLYAGIYEVSSPGKFIWVADNADDPASISGKAATVTFTGKLLLGSSYKVVFWAQKEGESFTIDWGRTTTVGPVVDFSPAPGNSLISNDESRDAFFGIYETGVVSGSIDLTGSVVELKRPFAQVNILLPVECLSDNMVAISSSMEVKNAPTKLNLITKETDTLKNWFFSTTEIAEAAFGNYAATHVYMAMNYVLVDQFDTSAYDIEFSVAAGNQEVNDKTFANVPLTANGRTNIIGNIFDPNFP